MAEERLNKFQEAVKTARADELLSNAIDLIAGANLKRLYAEIPLSTTSFDAGFRKVTYGDLTNAVNGMALWIHRTLWPSK